MCFLPVLMLVFYLRRPSCLVWFLKRNTSHRANCFPGSICYYFQKHLVRDNKATLTASKLRCRSLQEALEDSTLAYAEAQLCVCVSVHADLFMRADSCTVWGVFTSHLPLFLSSGHRFSCGILRGSEGRRQGRAICLLLTLSQWERRMDPVSRTLTVCQEENPRTKMGWYEKRR